MDYLLLILLSIIIYTEILPTLSIIFELLRTLITSKINIIHQKTIHIQEDIENTQSRLQKENVHVIGFKDETLVEEDESYE